jgi:hypothetical protein
MTDAPACTVRQCDEPGCEHEAVIQVGASRACYEHALERGNRIRASKGKPPILIDEEGRSHVRH